MNSFLIASAVLLSMVNAPATLAATVTPPSATSAEPTANTVPTSTTAAVGGVGPGGGHGEQLPVWAKCLADAPNNPPTDSTVASLFTHWCSNYETVIPCITAGLPTPQAKNPLDMFVKLHFDSADLRARSQALCQTFLGLGDRLLCLKENNGTLEAWCRARFSQGLQYIFAVQLQKAFDDQPDVYKELACEVTMDTSGCQGSAMTACDAEVKGHVLNYYSLLTNGSCVADPSLPYTTPAPPPQQRPPPMDVVAKCAQRILQIFPPTQPLPRNATGLQKLNYGLQKNCESYVERYNCLDRELQQINDPSFRDVWLSSTFNITNAIRSQREFCQAFEGGVIGQLTEDCYNNTQPSLQRCEGLYGNSVVSLQRQFVDGQIDGRGLQTAACRESMQRAVCIRDAFKPCSPALAETMFASEMGTLPDECFTLASPKKTNSNSNNEPTNTIDRKTPEPIPEAEGTVEDHHDWEHNHKISSVPDQEQSSPPAGVSASGATVGQSTKSKSRASGLSCGVVSLFMTVAAFFAKWN